MNLIELIVWDFDGVINNAVQDGEFIWGKKFEQDWGYSLKEFESFVFSGDFNDVLIGKTSLTSLVENWAKNVSFEGSVPDILKYWHQNDTSYVSEILEIIETVNRLGIRQVVATNTDIERTKFIKHHLHELRGVNEIYSSGLLKVAKPESAFFEILQRLEKKNPSEILFIDDSEKNIMGARNVGWNAIIFKPDSAQFIKDILLKNTLNHGGILISENNQ